MVLEMKNNICREGRFTSITGPLTHGAVVCLGLYGQKPCKHLKQCAKDINLDLTLPKNAKSRKKK
jgi:hypothetical protein